MQSAKMIKEEVLEEETQMPRPIEGLHEIGAPPFLTKTYEMVDDPATDEIVSWSNAKNSFIVWDSNKFSTDLLPRYFKHSNFSSFIRQLNTYGFRKVDPDRWEFASVGFLKGQKHLLKSIKRRRHAAQNVQHQGGASACVEVGQFGLEGVLERLKRDCSVLMTEIVRLKQQQHESREYIVALQDRLRAAERKQQQMMGFLAKAFNNPGFIQQFMLESAERNVLDGANVRRKRRIAAAEGTGEENFQEQQIDNLGVHDELNTLFRANVETESGSSTGGRVERTEPMAVTGGSNLDSVNEMLLDELLGENLELDNEDQLCLGDIPEVDDLEGRSPSDWGEDFHDLVDQMNYFQSKP